MRSRIAVVLCVTLTSFARCSLPVDQQYWKNLANNELEEALQVKWDVDTAKNVILMVGDGMGPNTVTATRIHMGGESYRLVYEKFPHVGLLKTYSANKMVADSASSATALFCGVKVNQMTVGVDATVKLKDCAGSLRQEARLKSLAALALEAGKSAGFVTTMRVTHATPGPLYAHSGDRKWECDSYMPADAAACKDIARQLVEDWPGRDLHVILGGGKQVLVSNLTGTPSEPLDSWSCTRKDGRNLIQEYKNNKEKRGLKYSFVSNTKELLDVDVDKTDYLLGIFGNSHMKYEDERDKGLVGMPSLSDMVEAAIKVLQKNKNGFFLMVEGGNIDMAHHRGWARRATLEAAALADAAARAAGLAPRGSLLILTSDHTHTLAINGYPLRGTDIFGIADKSLYDGINYTTLSYSTGGPASVQYYSTTDDQNRTVVLRRDPTQDDISRVDYHQAAGIRLDENSHGGGDVAIYARGPFAHLFHNVHEQHYVYHAISYAAKMGAYSSASIYLPNIILMCCIFVTSIVVK